MKKILLYNWDRIDGNLGSGVTKYIRNLASSLALDERYDIYFLNSGLSYSKTGGIRIEKIDNNISTRIHSFEIINSPVIAPITQSAKNISRFLSDESLYKLFLQFLISNKIDIIHFNNIEGLSLKCLQIRKDIPQIKLIYSAHNYSCICTRTNLWMNESSGGHNCNKAGYQDCVNCYRQNSYNATKAYRKYFLNNKIFHKIGLKLLVFSKADRGASSLYKDYEERTIQSLNSFDYILAVSNRVKNILLSHGISNSILRTSYIGTEIAKSQLGKCNAPADQVIFNIIYMGYMSKAKGFGFFIDSLEELYQKYPKVAKECSVHIVARYSSEERKSYNKIKNLTPYYYNISIINGYTKDNQQTFLQGMNLGIVPVMWEDNLPQVAIEQVASGVPILVSDLGGAQEICNNADFIFEAGNKEQFIDKLINIYEHRNLLNEFWKTSMKLVTMQEHIQELERFYAE